MAILVIELLLLASIACSRRHSEFARNVNLDRLEEEWKRGDSAEVLRRETDVELERMDYHRRRMEESFDPAAITPEDPAKGLAHAQSVLGPAMLFARLHSQLPDGNEMTPDEVDRLSFQWRELLFTGGVDVSAYDVGDLTVLLTLQHGWDGAQLRDFLLEQPEVERVTWDSRDYFKRRDPRHNSAVREVRGETDALGGREL